MPITHLFIDLDGTLYPNENGIWEEIARRMESFMLEHLSIPQQEIPEIRQQYYRQYGTTLRGLQANFEIDPHEFLAFVHDVPLSDFLKPDPHLREVLARLPQPKWILTNSDTAHAGRVLNALDVTDLFEGILDITSMGFINKPELAVYQKALEIAGNPHPQNCAFVDDAPQNLVQARHLGMVTILVGSKSANPETDFHIPDIYHLPEVIDQLASEEGAPVG